MLNVFNVLLFPGALCHLELKHFSEALTWCEEGLRIDPKDKKLLETRAKADRLKVRRGNFTVGTANLFIVNYLYPVSQQCF